MVANRLSFTDLTNRAISKVLFDSYGEKPEQYPDIYKIMSIDSGKDYKESEVSTLGVVPVKNEGEDIVYQDPTQLYDKTYTFATYASGYRVTEEMQEDDLQGIMGKKMASQLGRSLRYTIEQDAALLYNRATNDTYAGGDGVGLCSAAHPISTGSTGRNELATAADLSVASLRLAIQDMMATADYKGKLANIRPDILLVPPELYWKANELLKSANSPEDANNAINPLKGMLKLVVNDYLTDDDAAMLIDSSIYDVKWIWRVKPTVGVSSANDFDSGDLKYKLRARWARGWTGWRGVFLIQGA